MKKINAHVKTIMLLFLGVMTLALTSCSKETLDSAGRDTALNIIRTGVWKSMVRTVEGSTTPELNVRTELLGEDESINFDKDGRAWMKLSTGTAISYVYSMPSNKVMVFDGIEYQIRENIISSITTLTLENTNGAVKTTLVFKRNK